VKSASAIYSTRRPSTETLPAELAELRERQLPTTIELEAVEDTGEPNRASIGGAESESASSEGDENSEPAEPGE
jgi:hypothetical protein